MAAVAAAAADGAFRMALLEHPQHVSESTHAQSRHPPLLAVRRSMY